MSQNRAPIVDADEYQRRYGRNGGERVNGYPVRGAIQTCHRCNCYSRCESAASLSEYIAVENSGNGHRDSEPSSPSGASSR